MIVIRKYSLPKGLKMDKRNFISVTLLVSALAFNPLVATELNTKVTSSQRQIQTITDSIANLLHNRGLEEDAAYELSKNFVSDDALFEPMLNHLLDNYSDISEEKLFEYLSTAALHRQAIDLASYDHLVNLVSKINNRTLTEQELKRLSYVSKLNKLV
jgi:predicted nucleotidyltransferase